MDSTVSFSVIMTCYNLEKYIAEAILSIFHQDYQGPMELIIVDDCSQDNSVAIIKETIAKYAGGWDVTLVANEKNLGVSGASDQACKIAKYDWLVMADGDDIHDPRRCSQAAEIISEHPEAAMIMGSANHVDKNGSVYGYQGYTWQEYDKLDPISVRNAPSERLTEFMLPDGYPKWRYFGGCMTLNKAKVFTRWGDLVKEPDEERFAQDPVYGIRALLSGPIVAYREPACKYRSHETNMLNRSYNWEKLSDWFSRERHMQGFLHLSWRTIKAQLRQCTHALETPDISDFTQEEMETIRQHLVAMAEQHEILAHWWQYPWFKRLGLAINNPLPANYHKWPWPRLLPFRLYVFARWLIKQKLRRKG